MPGLGKAAPAAMEREDGCTTEQEINPGAERAAAGVAGVSGADAEPGAVYAVPGGQASARGLPGVWVLPGASGNGLTAIIARGRAGG